MFFRKILFPVFERRQIGNYLTIAISFLYNVDSTKWGDGQISRGADDCRTLCQVFRVYFLHADEETIQFVLNDILFEMTRISSPKAKC